MKKICRTSVVLVIFISSLSFSILTNAQPNDDPLVLEEIGLGISVSLKEWYQTQSGLTGNDAYFGAYVTLPIEDELYIGLASARPAENFGDGAYFAKFDGTQISGIGHFDEQGIHEMIWDGEVIHIAGTDPHNVITEGNNWDTGNHYNYSLDDQTLTKYRDPVNGLVYAFHSWGLWKDDNILYAAVSSHDGSYPSDCEYGVTCFGQIFSSTNNGITWTLKANLGDYRAYHIIGNGDQLYAISNDELTGPLSLSRSSDSGETWFLFPELIHNVGRSHMVVHQDRVIATSFDRSSIYSVDRSNNIEIHPLPAGFLLGTGYADRPAFSDYKILKTASGYLYLIAEDQNTYERVIFRTFNLEDWQEIVRTSENLISLSFWPANNWLVTSSNGINAKLWEADLSKLSPLIYLPIIRK